MLTPDELKSRLLNIRILLTDVDGVLTDGTVSVAESGEFKRFNIQDGLGLHLLHKAGIKTGWISSRWSPVTSLRAKELKINYVFQEPGPKILIARNILSEAELSFENVCYAGDDLVDLALVRQAGVGIAVANAVEELKGEADYITRAPGGGGAVREIVELILKTQGKWDALVASYLTLT
jgi:3-deoxy-D-manno-octulosonate 8-phosphate phosphatase (KDO 8-P phosphatase)